MSSPAPPPQVGYPAEQETDVVLRDGSTIHVRPVRADDRAPIQAFLEGVSAESLSLRFFASASLKWAAEWSVDVDYADRYGLVAETGSPRRIVAHAAYVRADARRAEVAFLVPDAWQDRGIATILLAHLAAVAERHGIATFFAEVLPANSRMLGVFRLSGFPVHLRSEPGAIHVELPTSLSEGARLRFADRDRLAAVAAVSNVLRPRSVAVIGASSRPGAVGAALWHNLLSGGFTGTLYAVNPYRRSVGDAVAYRSMLDLPEPVDLAIIAVRAERVLQVARECAEAGTRALVVVSAGFAETGAAGQRRQRDLLALCRDRGMRLVGPNCLGVLNTDPAVALNGTFASHPAHAGRVGFTSQSGGLGIAIVESAASLGLGLSSFVSMGNKADLSGNDFLQYWEQDPATDVVLLYLESFGNPRKFARIARRVSAVKPIIALKSGRSPAGARATASHTGALLASSDVTVDALFRQAGVIRADTLAEMLQAAALMSAQPIPSNARVAILTNAGGPGIVCADACQAVGLEVPEPGRTLAEELRRLLPEAASVANPIDMLATASAGDYKHALQSLIRSGSFGAILTIFVPTLTAGAAEVATVIHRAAKSTSRCAIAAVFMTANGPPKELSSGPATVPGFQLPEEAAHAMAHAARYGRWRGRPAGCAWTPEAITVERAAAVISRELAAGAGWMSPDGVSELLTCYGIPQAPWRLANTPHAAARAAAELGLPVALKGTAPGLVHKRDVGAVAVNLSSGRAVERAAATIARAVSAAGHALGGFIVQPMIGDGIELLVGVVQDASFGPVLACGAGGTNVELLRDVAVRITPVTDRDAAEMVRELRTFPLLEGYRGGERRDVAALERTVLRVSAMVEAHPEIVELDCNPTIVRTDGVVVVDARVRIEPGAAPLPVPAVGR